jgi:hypothetical protein
MATPPDSIDGPWRCFGEHDYVSDRISRPRSFFLALALERALLLEVGVDMTEPATVRAATLDRQLVRFQCFESHSWSSESILV